MSSSKRSQSPDRIEGLLPWGCRIMVDPYTHWPLNLDILHIEWACRCYSQESPPLGSGTVFVRDYLFAVAYEYHYRADPDKYNALACNEIVKTQAARLGVDLQGRLIWDLYPSVLPPPPTTWI
ncbi:hypothetical protein F4678DRAFT_31458 [Xylaria arbuscula]|nr:hypothetical protein F4678DRAFT_31458 [Xylaria arbuscula]